VSAADEALLEAVRLGPDDDVLVLGGAALALGAQKRLENGWVYVVRHEVTELEELLVEAHAAGATGLAYLVGEVGVLPLPDNAVAAAVGRVQAENGAPAVVAEELARVLAAGGRVALGAVEHPSAQALAEAFEHAGFRDVVRLDTETETVVAATST
jgi:ubiquinone/menaquinone biosynthesis C-methylase UbiE